MRAAPGALFALSIRSGSEVTGRPAKVSSCQTADLDGTCGKLSRLCLLQFALPDVSWRAQAALLQVLGPCSITRVHLLIALQATTWTVLVGMLQRPAQLSASLFGRHAAVLAKTVHDSLTHLQQRGSAIRLPVNMCKSSNLPSA